MFKHCDQFTRAALTTQKYLGVALCTKQHGHVSEHAHRVEGNGGNALCVQHVCIVPAVWVSKDVPCLRAVASVGRQHRHCYGVFLNSAFLHQSLTYW